MVAILKKVAPTPAPEETKIHSKPVWVHYKEAFEILQLGDRYRYANGKKYNSYVWLQYRKMIEGTHPENNFHRDDVRFFSKKFKYVRIQMVDLRFVYPRFVRTEKLKMVA